MNPAEQYTLNLLGHGWHKTPHHHAGDLYNPQLGIMLEIKHDQQTATTQRLCIETGDIACHWTQTLPGGTWKPCHHTITNQAWLITTGVRKTSYLANLYGWHSIYLHYTHPNPEHGGILYTSNTMLNHITTKYPHNHTPWKANRTMHTTGALIPLNTAPGWTFTHPRDIPHLIRAAANSDTPLTGQQWFASHPHHRTTPFPRATLYLHPEPKSGLHPYPNLAANWHNKTL